MSTPTSLLSFNLHRDRHGSRSNTRVGLHPDGVNGVWGEVTDCGQFVVVHHLETPRCHWLIRIGAVVHFITLESNKSFSNVVTEGQRFQIPSLGHLAFRVRPIGSPSC